MQNDICPRCKLSINHPMSPVRPASSVVTTYRDGNEGLLFLMLAIGLVVLGLLYLLCVQSYAPSGYSVFDNGMVYGEQHEFLGCKQGYRIAEAPLSTRQARLQGKDTFEYCRIDN